MAVIKKNGGYTGLPISISRGNPIPLDKSSIYYEYEQMASYATSDPTAYVGQIVVLVDEFEKKATAYIIKDVEGTLQEIGATASAEVFEQLQQTIQELQEQIGSQDDSSGIYQLLDEKADKKDTYTKLEVDEKLSGFNHLERKIVQSVADIEQYLDTPDADQYIFMVPTENESENNSFDEYLIIDGDIELVGSWSVNLNQYATLDDLYEKVDKKSGYDLVSQDEINKLSTVEEGAQKNYITSVTLDFQVIDGQLNLVPLTIEKIQGLREELDNKVSRKFSSKPNPDGEGIIQEEWGLLSPDDKKKLDALIIGESGGIEVSGKVSAENVDGLAQWIEENRDVVNGLFSVNDYSKLRAIQDGAEKNFINSVSEDFTVTSGRELQLNPIDASKIVNIENNETISNLSASVRSLQTNITQKLDTSEFITYQQTVSQEFNNIEQKFDNYVTTEQLSNEVTGLRSALRWRDF